MSRIELSSREQALLLGEIDWQSNWLREEKPQDSDFAASALMRLERAVLDGKPIEAADVHGAMLARYRVDERGWLLDRIMETSAR